MNLRPSDKKLEHAMDFLPLDRLPQDLIWRIISALFDTGEKQSIDSACSAMRLACSEFISNLHVQSNDDHLESFPRLAVIKTFTWILVALTWMHGSCA